MDSPTPSDSSSSVDIFHPPVMRFAQMYLITCPWDTYEHLCKHSIRIGEITEHALHCFAKAVAASIDHGSVYWTNAYAHFCDDGMTQMFFLCGPFKHGTPLNGAQRIEKLIHDAIMDISANFKKKVENEKVLAITVSKFTTSFESAEK